MSRTEQHIRNRLEWTIYSAEDSELTHEHVRQAISSYEEFLDRDELAKIIICLIKDYTELSQRLNQIGATDE